MMQVPHRTRRLRDNGNNDDNDADVNDFVDDVLAAEAPLALQLREHDGPWRHVAVLMRTPDDDDLRDEELVLGFLRTEGVIDSARDVAAIGHCTTVEHEGAEGNVVQVRLHDGVRVDWARLQRSTFSSSSCGVCGKASIEAVCQLVPPATSPAPAPPSLSWCVQATTTLQAQQPLFAATGACHGAMLQRAGGHVVAVREDVGRHNAVDKVIGHALRSGVFEAFDDVVLVVSGRIAFEIVQKAAMVGLRTIVAVGAPTSLAVELAATCGITLVGFVRAGRANVY
jgi:FdhD protein